MPYILTKTVLLTTLLFSVFVYSPTVSAFEDISGGGYNPEGAAQEAEDDDFKGTPSTEYGDFGDGDAETKVTQFFQYGRFFGISLGFGFQGVQGNRGLLWEGGFPLIGLRAHYWFNFNLGLQLGFFSVSHFHNFGGKSTSINVIHIGIDIKYYFDTRNLSSAITFAHPHILIGGGSFRKTESEIDTATPDVDNTVGIGFGAGLEFPISVKETYFTIQSMFYFAQYQDNFSSKFTPTIEDLSGYFYWVAASLMFVW